VVASYNTGHKDVLTTGNSLMLTQMRSLSISANGQPVAVWEEPDIDEVVANLDWAYHHRDDLRSIGRRASQDMAALTWARTARLFFAALSGGNAAGTTTA
jgi:hypothetical protein